MKRNKEFPVDIVGQPITEGCKVLNPIRKDSCNYVSSYIVRTVGEDGVKFKNVVGVFSPKYCLVVEYP